ncbi:MAG: hypothetical protein J6D28_03315 [Bacilli bacterium]|nr:hypothetical protein [Bacilli bacterium]
MDKVLISNAQGESGIVNVVRYFVNNGSEYLIYSLNEVDESGYTRLYVAKLSGVDGVYSGDTLNDVEWNDIKNLVKTIVKANKEGLPVPVQDLNPKKINNIMLKDKKVFKLNAPLVNDLGSNRPNFGSNDESGSQATMNPFATSSQPVFDVSSAPTFAQPVQPSFDMPSVATPEQPVQPSFDVSSAPAFEQPVQPSFGMPSAPTFDQAVQPSFGMPSAPTFEQPVQSSFDMPSVATPEQPVQSSFDMPSVATSEQPVQSSYNFGSTNTMDYQSLYNSELEKNQSMQNEIDKLNEELSKYKNMISNLKEIIEK